MASIGSFRSRCVDLPRVRSKNSAAKHEKSRYKERNACDISLSMMLIFARRYFESRYFKEFFDYVSCTLSSDPKSHEGSLRSVSGRVCFHAT